MKALTWHGKRDVRVEEVPDLYGSVPGGRAEYLRVPQAHYGPIKVPHGPADDRFVYLSDVLPTAWQAVKYANVPEGGSVMVLGLGPIRDMACPVARQLGAGKVIGVDLVPERLQRARVNGFDVLDLSTTKDVGAAVREMTDGRGPDSVVEAVGMEAHSSAVSKLACTVIGLLPEPLLEKAGTDRLGALYLAIYAVRRGGTISISGVYGGAADPMPMLQMFDKQLQLRMGQAHVRRWSDEILPLLTDEDPLGVDTFATQHLPLEEAPAAYERFQKKEDGYVKVLLNPWG
jgi:threonine dehydrogenase-like Zn-dependent dehydrogenase